MKLKSFLTLLFLTLLLSTAATNYYAYRSDQQIVIDYIGDWSSSALIQTEAPIAEGLKNGRVSLIQKLLDKGVASRPFIVSLSLTLDNAHYYLSSDRSLQGKTFVREYTEIKGPIKTLIANGITDFKLPVEYYTEGRQHHADLLMTLDRQYIFESIVIQSLKTTGQVVVAVSVVFGLLFLLFYRFLVLPINDIITFVTTKKGALEHYYIHDFSKLGGIIRENFSTLMEQKQQIQNALNYERHLESILQTVAAINKLLIISKDRDDLIQRSCDRLARHGDYRLAWIGFIAEGCVDIAAHSNDTTGYLKGGLGISLDPSDPTSKGPAAQSILTNRTVIINDLIADPRFTPWKDRADLSAFHSIISLPLRPDNYSDPIGVLAIYTSNPEGFDPKEVSMLEELAGDIGFAVNAFEQRETLQYHLTTDGLTGLPNRAMLLDALGKIPVPEVMIVNIDQFKEINEVYGFEVGDAFIKGFARGIQAAVEAYPQLTLYSLGIDSFALLFATRHGIDIPKFADTLVTTLETRQYECLGINILPQITTGYARSEQQTVERAELALKLAKEQKKNLVIFEPSLLMIEHHQENIQWYNVVRKAIDEGRIVPYFQGIVDNATKETVKYETLMRLITPDGDAVAPGHFLEVAKKTRLYPELTLSILTKAIETFKDRSETLSINVSLEDILNDTVVDTLKKMISQSDMGERITFEILESEGIQEYDRVTKFIRTFKGIGCKIAIDDFGSGYSNFEHLLNLQIDYLKIDGSLIQNIVHDQNAQVLVKHIHSFASDLNMKTIAEFVSCGDIYTKVTEIGIDYSQGYHFHKPVPMDELPDSGAERLR